MSNTDEHIKELLKGHEKGLSSLLESSYEDDENSLIETYKNQLKK